MEYLGHMFYSGGLGVEKVEGKAILSFPQPKNVNWLQTFLGLYNYYQRFVKGFSNITKPLTQLTQFDHEVIQGEV